MQRHRPGATPLGQSGTLPEGGRGVSERPTGTRIRSPGMLSPVTVVVQLSRLAGYRTSPGANTASAVVVLPCVAPGGWHGRTECGGGTGAGGRQHVACVRVPGVGTGPSRVGRAVSRPLGGLPAPPVVAVLGTCPTANCGARDP